MNKESGDAMISGYRIQHQKCEKPISYMWHFQTGTKTTQNGQGSLLSPFLSSLLFLKHEGWGPSWDPGLTSCSSNFSHQRPLTTIPLWDAFVPFIAGSLVLFTKWFFNLKLPDSHTAPCLTLCKSEISPIPNSLSPSHRQSNSKEPSMPSYNPVSRLTGFSALTFFASSGESPANRQGHSSGPQNERKLSTCQVHATPNKMETISPPLLKPIQDGHIRGLPPSSSQWPVGHSLLCCYCRCFLYQRAYDHCKRSIYT